MAVVELSSSWLVEQGVRGFESGSHHFSFRDWVSPASKSRYDGNINVKATEILKTTHQQNKGCEHIKVSRCLC